MVISSTDNLEKSRLYSPLLPWLNTGLLTSGGMYMQAVDTFVSTRINFVVITGKKWHTRRKILTQAFHFNILRQFVNVFVRKTEDLVYKLEEKCENSVDVLPLITTFTLHSICGKLSHMYLREALHSTKISTHKKSFNL